MNEVVRDMDGAVQCKTASPFRAMFRADWNDALFIHFRVDPAVLQPLVPLALDLFEGQAYISLVAFTQENLRPCLGGKVAAWMSGPLASHEFLNVRTYVRWGEERGIYFLAEWIPNRLAAFLGPRLYGLPYRIGVLKYGVGAAEIVREVKSSAGRFCCRARVDAEEMVQPCREGSEAAFLLERYTAFTRRKGILRRFHIRHEPWLQAPAKVVIERRELLDDLVKSDPVSAHFSRGVANVRIGRPERLTPAAWGGWIAFTPLLLLPIVACAWRSRLPGWGFMWAIAWAIFFGFKWLTLCRALVGKQAAQGRALAYLFGWVGMDAGAFLDGHRLVAPPTGREWFRGAINTLCGAVLVWGVVPWLPMTHPLLVAWVGMVGLILLLHFGTFDLLARLWQRAGVDAKPTMNRPIASRSLSDFWGNRWNTGFRELSHRLLFRPFHRWSGAGGAMVMTFFASGLIHDLVITLPARGGYGLPTLYFLIQAAGVGIERSAVGKAIGLHRGAQGWLFAMLFTLAPLALLFPPVFVLRVMVPFLQVIGSIRKGLP